MKLHSFVVYGSPVAQGRPRFARIGAGVRTYDPEKSRGWKQEVRSQVLKALNDVPEIHDGALVLALAFHLQRPKSLSKRVIFHVKKPDLDNLVKAFKDSAKGILWHDDSQVVQMTVRKVYGTTPQIIAEVRG